MELCGPRPVAYRSTGGLRNQISWCRIDPGARLEEPYRSPNQSCQLKIEVDHGSLTPERLQSALDLRVSQIKRFLVQNRNPDGSDDLLILLSKVSLHDVATYPERLTELDVVREVTILKKRVDLNGSAT